MEGHQVNMSMGISMNKSVGSAADLSTASSDSNTSGSSGSSGNGAGGSNKGVNNSSVGSSNNSCTSCEDGSPAYVHCQVRYYAYQAIIFIPLV